MKQSKFIKRNSATVLSILGSIGVIATSVSAVKSTPKAIKLIEESERNKGKPLSRVETIKIAAPVYMTTIVTGTATIFCILGSNMLSRRQQATMASAYAFLEQSYSKYKSKVIEHYGEEAHNKIIEEIAAEETLHTYPYVQGFVTNYSQCLEDEYGESHLFYDTNGQRYFRAPLEQLLMAEYHINRIFTTQGSVLLNDFYEYLGLEPTPYGSKVGWAVSDEYEMYWIDFNHRKSTLRDGTVYYLIETSMDATHEAIEDWY